MAKRTNPVAWGLAGVLAVVVLAGAGTVLAHGVTLGNQTFQIGWTSQWLIGRDPRMVIGCGPGFSSTTRSYGLGYASVTVVTTESWPVTPRPQPVPIRTKR